MQTFFLFSHGQSSGPGSSIRDPEIETSDLAALIRKVFADLQPPRDVIGAVKLAQDRNNPDRFFLYFFASTDSEAYTGGSTYTAPDIAIFERTEFEQFPHAQRDCRRILEEFSRRLVVGELKHVQFE